MLADSESAFSQSAVMAECKQIGPEDALKKLSEQVTCAVCLCSYADPKVLQCFHVFCKSCLKKLVVRSFEDPTKLTITCPICRDDTDLSACGNGVADLQSAFHIHNLLEIESGLKPLKDIIENEKIENSEERSRAKKKDEVKCCPNHENEKISLFCESCKEFICVKCTIQSHNGHQYNIIKDALERNKDELTMSLKPAKKELKRMEKIMSKFHERCDQVLAQRSEIEAQIKDLVGQLQQVLEVKKKDLFGCLRELSNAKLMNLDMEKSEVQIFQTKVSSCIDFVTKLIESGNDEKILKEADTTVQLLNDVCAESQQANPQPQVIANMIMIAELEASRHCLNSGTLANITTFSECPKKCYATGSLSVANLGEVHTITVHIVDHNDRPCVNGCLNKIQFEIVSEFRKDKKISGSAKRKKDDQYEIFYKPISKGSHVLHITINDKHIGGSPFTITVKSTIKSLCLPITTISCTESPCGLTMNQHGELLVTNEHEDRITVLRQDGEMVREFGVDYVSRFTDLAVSDDGSIYVVDTGNHQVVKFSPDGNLLSKVGEQGRGLLKFNNPMGIAFNSKNKKIYITSAHNHEVQVLNLDLTFDRKFGEEGSEKKQFRYPWGITCDTLGRVFVADGENERVQVFAADGRFIKTFGKTGARPGDLKWPTGITTDAANFVYVSEAGNKRVSIFGPDGQFWKCFGEGNLTDPRGITVDSNSGVVFVCNFDNSRIQVY